MPIPLTIRLLGPLRVFVRGQPLPRVRTRSVEWVLALLVLRHGRAVSRSWLAGTLWPDSEESQALANLRNDLMYLRRALGPEGARLRSPTRDTLTLDLEGAEVDVLAFDAALRRGDEASLRTAVESYHGPLLEGCLEEWVFAERESRAQACLAALETLADAAEQRSDLAGALASLRRAEGMDPLRDSTQRRLMRVLAAGGDLPAALLAYREHRSRLRQEMNLEPDEATVRLYQELRERSKQLAAAGAALLPAPPPPAPTSWVPAAARGPVSAPTATPHPITGLIGREQEVREIAAAIRASRLVTLVGAGGVGKTRLAIEVASHSPRDPLPVEETAFAALAPLSDPALLPGFVAAALGLREEPAAEPGSLLKALVWRLSAPPLLLVLDNCEHLLEAAGALAQALLEGCPDLRILATSRERLGLTGEVVRRVPSLALPPEVEGHWLRVEGPDRGGGDPSTLDPQPSTLLKYPAVQLFVERAAMVREGFSLGEGREALAVAQICHRLDGIPLAIELAAARMAMLTAGQLAARLNDRFRILTGGSKAALPRHQTLQALIDWSYDLLAPAEQVLLRRLSVFAGGWTLEAAEEVCGEILDLLTSLMDKSLVLAEEGEGGLRYRMLETIREYAGEKLRASGEEGAVRNHHLACFLRRAEAAAPALHGPSPEEVLTGLSAERGNFSAALAWAQAECAPPGRHLQLAAALWPYWVLSGTYSEGHAQLRAALDRPGMEISPERAGALLGAAMLARLQDDWGEAVALGQESRRLFRALGDPRGAAQACFCAGRAALDGADIALASVRFREGLQDCRRVGWAQGAALACWLQGRAAAFGGDLEQARAYLEEGLALAEAAGDAPLVFDPLESLGLLAVGIGDYHRAIVVLDRAVAIHRRLGHRHAAMLTLRSLGGLTRRLGDLPRARGYLEEAVALSRELGNMSQLAFILHDCGGVYYVQGAYELAERAFSEALVLFRRQGTQHTYVGNNLGSTLFHLGELERARALHREALGIYQERESVEGIAWSLERLAVVEAEDGDPQRAARLLGAASRAREQFGKPMAPWDQADWDRAVSAVQGTLGSGAFAELWSEGRASGPGDSLEQLGSRPGELSAARRRSEAP